MKKILMVETDHIRKFESWPNFKRFLFVVAVFEDEPARIKIFQRRDIFLSAEKFVL